MSENTYLKKSMHDKGTVFFNRNLLVSFSWRFHILPFIPPINLDQMNGCLYIPCGRELLCLVPDAVPSMLHTLLCFFLTSVTLLMKFFPWGNFNIIFLIGSVRFDLTDFD